MLPDQIGLAEKKWYCPMPLATGGKRDTAHAATDNGPYLGIPEREILINIYMWLPRACGNWVHGTAISPLYKLIWPLHVRIRGNWAESVSTLLKKGAIVRSLGDTGTKMAPSLCWDLKLSNEGSFVEIGQEMTRLGWKVWKKSLQSLRAESIAVCMQQWSFRRRSLS